MKKSWTNLFVALLSGLIIVTGCSQTERPTAMEDAGSNVDGASPRGSGARLQDAGSVYDATADFEAGWLAGDNPNGVWSYGWTDGIAGALTLFTRTHVPNVNNGLEQMWDDPNNNFGYTPSVARNAGPDFDDGNVTYIEGALILHPCGNSGTSYAHVIWTAPVDGEYSLSSTFFAQQNGIDVDVHILVDGVSVFDETITSNGESRSFSGIFSLSSGGTIDFAVGPNGYFTPHPGNTGLDARIERVEYVTICHQPGTPAEKTLDVPVAAVAGHLGHGDVLGPCE